MVLQLLETSCWYCDNCITKLWDLSPFFLYLYMVFIQHCFHLEQHCFHLDRQFSCSSNISKWLSRIPTQSSLVIQNSCSSWPSCTLSPLLYKCSVFHPWFQVRFTYILSTNVCQLQTSFTPIYFFASCIFLHSLQNAFSLQCAWLRTVSIKNKHGILQGEII